MAYEKQNFEDGNVLSAEELNHIESGIEELEKELEKKQPTGEYIAKGELTDAVEAALNLAKESGAFDGPQGPAGSDANVTAANIKSALGYTPADQTDVNNLSKEVGDKLPKNQGAENVGKILMVGTDGNLVLTEVPEGQVGDVVGTIDENNNILLSGDIADGTYKLKYEYDDGDIREVGSIVISSIVTYSITKTLSNCTASGATTINKDGTATVIITANNGYKLPDSIAVSGASCTWDKASGQIVLSNPTDNVAITVTAVSAGPTNLADPTSAYWKEGYRLSISSGGTSAVAGRTSTNFIPAKAEDVLRVKGMSITERSNDQDAKIVMYSTKDNESSKLGGMYGATSASNKDAYGAKVTVNGDVSTYTLFYNNEGVQKALSGTQYIRIEGVLLDGYTSEDVVITINEEIV